MQTCLRMGLGQAIFPNIQHYCYSCSTRSNPTTLKGWVIHDRDHKNSLRLTIKTKVRDKRNIIKK